MDSGSEELGTMLWLTLGVILLVLLSLALAVRFCLRSLKPAENSEVSFRGLRADQIAGKIRGKY